MSIRINRRLARDAADLLLVAGTLVCTDVSVRVFTFVSVFSGDSCRGNLDSASHGRPEQEGNLGHLPRLRL